MGDLHRARKVPPAAKIERDFYVIASRFANALDRIERLLQLGLRDKRTAVPGEGIDRAAVIRIYLDAANSALQKEIGQHFGVRMLPHAVDRPTIHGVVHHQLLLRFTAEQLINRKTGRLAENVPLSDVDGREHTKIGAAPRLVGDVIENILPQALDFGRILSEDQRSKL